MGANCQGTCYPTNQYDIDISQVIERTQYKRLDSEELVSRKLQLGPERDVDASTREALLRECPFSQLFN